MSDVKTKVNIAFSSGVESMYMLQMAMERDMDITLVFINVGVDPRISIGEIARMQKTIDFFRDHENKNLYPGRIVDVIYCLRSPHGNIPIDSDHTRSAHGLMLISNSMTQQWATVLGMMKVRQAQLNKHGGYPTTFIGWAKDDSSDVSFCENDFSSGMYQELLHAPIRIGRMGNSDNLAKPFRAPLWDLSKEEIFRRIDADIRGNVMPNGQCTFSGVGNLIVHTPFPEKVEEYKKARIPVQDKYEFDISEQTPINYLIRRFAKFLRHTDFDLPKEADHLIDLLQENPILQERQAWITGGELVHLRGNFIRIMKDFHAAAGNFEWPGPVTRNAS